MSFHVSDYNINGVHFLLLATESPQDIYGLPLSIFICDEIDELQQRIGLMVFEAMNERTSQLLPDGRKPFRVYLTTSQGLKTIYSIYLKLLEIGADFIRIKGKTKDNLKNSPDYVSRLYSLYTREEQMAYLEGEFVNIARGSVYPDFNELLHVVDPFSIDASETIFVGQDKNIGYNKACCFIKKNKNLYMIKEFSFKSISDAPQIIRTAFPTNPIFWYPDASAAELLAGYANEIKRFDINLRVGSVNPSRLARVFVVNKMFKLNRSFVFRNNPMAILALKVRTYDDSGMPAKGKGEDAPDHIMDGWDYGEWRIVMSDPDFSDIKEVTGKVR